MGITNSHFNTWVSLFKFVDSIGLSFETYFHDAVKLSPVLQARIADETEYGYVYIRSLAATPDQQTILTYHLANKDIDNPATHVILKQHVATIHDAFRTEQIPFIDIDTYIGAADMAVFMASASMDDISAKILAVPQTAYYHNGQYIQFYLTEFGEAEPVELDGITGVALQISLQHYAPDNFASLA